MSHPEEKMRILLMCVGLNDPTPQGKPDQDGPILSFMDYISRIPEYQSYRPDRIYLISTADKPGAVKPTQQNGNRVEQELKRRGWSEVYHRPLDVLDPTDYSELLPQMKRMVQSILEEPGNQEAEVLVNVSPGTGQMEAVWMALMNAGVLKARALQVKAPWDEPDERKRVREVDFTPLFESGLIRIAHDLFSQYAFQRAAEVLTELAIRTPDVNRAERAELFADLSKVYADVENFEYPKAKEGLQRILERYHNLLRDSSLQALQEQLQAQTDALEKLVKQDLLTAALDLYASAERRLELGHYVECIWRLWATYELVVTEKARETIRNACSLDPSFPLPYMLRRFVTQGQGQKEVQSIVNLWGDLQRVPKYLGRDAAEELLRRRGDSGIRQFLEDREDEIESLAQLRHRAVHEVNPPTEEDCTQGQALIRGLLRQTFRLQRIDYPFQPKRLKRIADMIQGV